MSYFFSKEKKKRKLTKNIFLLRDASLETTEIEFSIEYFSNVSSHILTAYDKYTKENKFEIRQKN